ncbi:MAG: hypothetical protein V3V33_13080 [Candidatus Lokiarchaeia archaeon]
MNDIEFKINNYILLRLEGNYTVIFVKGRRFDYCKRLFIVIPETNVENYDRIESIDEATDLYDHYLIDNEMYKEENGLLYPPLYSYNIPPEVEFWGHCSNIQAWVEHDYNTRVLHSNLAFPLLKELTKAGDPKAKEKFKEEIAKRLISGYFPTIKYLISEGYIFYLTVEELLCTLDVCRENLDYIDYIKLIYEIMEKWYEFDEDIDKRIIKRENMINFFLGQLKDPKMQTYSENYIDGFHEKLNKELDYIFDDFNSTCLELCWDYSKAGMYDKLERHCTLLLTQDTKSSYIWHYLGIAYHNKGLTTYAKVAENVYQLKEKLRTKRIKKIVRKNRMKRFLWRYFLIYFHSNYWRSRKRYKRNMRNKC